MYSHLFHGYGALLIALGLVEVTAVPVYDVISITREGYPGGSGCLVYIPFPGRGYLEFIAGTEQHYEEIQEKLLEALRDKDALLRAINTVENSLLTVKICAETEGEYFFYPEKITSCSYCYWDDSLRFKYDGREVVMMFSFSAGLRAIANVLVKKGAPCRVYE